MSALQDLEFHLKEHWVIDIELNNANRQPIQLQSMSTLEWRVATTEGGSPVLTVSLIDGITVADPTTNQCTAIVTPAKQTSSSIAAGLYKHELKGTTAGLVTVQARGTLTVLPAML